MRCCAAADQPRFDLHSARQLTPTRTSHPTPPSSDNCLLNEALHSCSGALRWTLQAQSQLGCGIRLALHSQLCLPLSRLPFDLCPFIPLSLTQS